MSFDSTEDLLREAIRTAQQGDRATARQMLQQVIVRDERSELAWIWLATVADSPTERRRYLERVLEINPNNARARQALRKLESTAEPASRAARAPRRRGALLGFFIVAVLAVTLITIGVLLLVDVWQEGEATPAARPAATTAAPAAALDPSPTATPRTTLFPTSSVGTGEAGPLPPTWTPTATWTPTPSPEPSPTPPALADAIIVGSQQTEGQGWRLFTARADGTELEPLEMRLSPDFVERTEAELLDVFDAAYSPDGSQLVMTVRLSTPEGERSELFLAPANGGELEPLTALGAEEAVDAAWSPDGEQIAFAANPNGHYDLYLVPVSGGDAVALTEAQSDERYPAWSPDGMMLAYASDQGGPGTLEIWRMPVVGGEAEQLTDAANNSFAPDYAPNGDHIVFISDRGGDPDLYIMNADGTGERILTVNDLYRTLDPAWSPDGAWILVSCDREAPLMQICVIRPDGTGYQRLTETEALLRYGDWRPGAQVNTTETTG